MMLFSLVFRLAKPLLPWFAFMWAIAMLQSAGAPAPLVWLLGNGGTLWLFKKLYFNDASWKNYGLGYLAVMVAGVVGGTVATMFLGNAGILVAFATMVATIVYLKSESGSAYALQIAAKGGGWKIAGLIPSKGAADGRTAHQGSGKYGTASFQTGAALKQAQDGVLLGRDLQSGKHLLRWNQPGHVVTIAPPRAGKGVAAVIPNALTYAGSMLVNDPKAEVYEVTAEARRAMGQKVHALDPFGIAASGDRYNPFDMIDVADDNAIGDAAVFAEMLIVSDSKGGQSDAAQFFNGTAKSILSALILHVCSSEVGARRNLGRVRELLCLAPQQQALLWEHMSESKCCGGVIARMGNKMQEFQADPKLYNNIMASILEHTRWLDMPQMARVLSESTCDVRDLKADLSTVYMILPPEHLDTCNRWARLVLSCALLGMTRKRGRPAGGRDVVFMLDEFAQLGYIPPFVKWYTTYPGYGVKFWLVLQNAGQLEALYGDGPRETILGGAGVLQAFRVNDNKTAKLLEERMGDMTVTVQQANRGKSGKALDLMHTGQQGVTTSETGRKLMFASEIMQMPPEQQLLFLSGEQPLLARKLTYYSDPEFVGLYADTSMHASV